MKPSMLEKNIKRLNNHENRYNQNAGFWLV